MHVATLIAGPAAKSLLAGIIAALQSELHAKADWLAPEEACDLLIDGAAADIEAPDIEAAARRAIGGAAIDVVVQPREGRRKRLLVADLESTIIENEMLEELADHVGQRVRVAEITRRAMNGELDFIEALTERVALLAGLPETVLEDATAHIRLMPGARTLLATSCAAGVRTALVSGGFTVFANPIAADLGFERVIANHLDVAHGQITGAVRAPIVTRDTKREALLSLVAEFGLAPSEVIAVGDGANDLPMLHAAGLGIAFRAKPSVAAAVHWRIDHADLTGLLYAQGYHAAEILTSLSRTAGRTAGEGKI